NYSNNTVVIDGVTYPAVKSVYDYFTEKVYYLNNNSKLYKATTFDNSNSTSYKFEDSDLVTEFNYIYISTDNTFEFRPAARYFVFANYKLTAITRDNATEGSDSFELIQAINSNGYATHIPSNRIITQSTV